MSILRTVTVQPEHPRRFPNAHPLQHAGTTHPRVQFHREVQPCIIDFYMIGRVVASHPNALDVVHCPSADTKACVPVVRERDKPSNSRQASQQLSRCRLCSRMLA